MMGLTPVQCRALDAIRAYMAEHDGVAPSYQEIAAAIGLRSKGGIHRIMLELVERGAITMIPGRPRSIGIVEWRTAFHLPPDIELALRLHCSATNEDMNAVVSDAVTLFLDGASPKVGRRAMTDSKQA